MERGGVDRTHIQPGRDDGSQPEQAWLASIAEPGSTESVSSPTPSPTSIYEKVLSAMLIIVCIASVFCAWRHGEDVKAFKALIQIDEDVEVRSRPFIAPKSWDEENRAIETPVTRPNLYRI